MAQSELIKDFLAYRLGEEQGWMEGTTNRQIVSVRCRVKRVGGWSMFAEMYDGIVFVNRVNMEPHFAEAKEVVRMLRTNKEVQMYKRDPSLWCIHEVTESTSGRVCIARRR